MTGGRTAEGHKLFAVERDCSTLCIAFFPYARADLGCISRTRGACKGSTTTDRYKRSQKQFVFGSLHDLLHASGTSIAFLIRKSFALMQASNRTSFLNPVDWRDFAVRSRRDFSKPAWCESKS